MTKRLTLCLTLALLTAFATATAFAQDGTITPEEQKGTTPGTAAPAGNVAENGAPAGTEQGENPMGSWPLYLLLGLLVLMFVFSSRSRKKQEAKRREMLDAIKKGDTVTSIGGIIGTVVEVRDRDLIIKIDESTRIKLARWAVRGVGEDSMTETEKKDGQK